MEINHCFTPVTRILATSIHTPGIHTSRRVQLTQKASVNQCPGTSVQSEEGNTQARKHHTSSQDDILILEIIYMTNPHRWCGDVISFLTQSSSQIGHTPSTKLQPQEKSFWRSPDTPRRRLADKSIQIFARKTVLACGHRVSRINQVGDQFKFHNSGWKCSLGVLENQQKTYLLKL